MRGRTTSWKAPDEAITDGALDAISLEELREIVRDLLPWLDGKILARLTNDLIDRAARGGSGWTPSTPSEARIAKIERKAGLALREVFAEPAEANAVLLEGTYAFLGKAYDAAVRIYRAWLLPLAVVESQDALAWLAQVRESYRRRSALQKEFQAYLAKLAGRGE